LVTVPDDASEAEFAEVLKRLTEHDLPQVGGASDLAESTLD
jgi:hypothetical protein